MYYLLFKHLSHSGADGSFDVEKKENSNLLDMKSPVCCNKAEWMTHGLLITVDTCTSSCVKRAHVEYSKGLSSHLREHLGTRQISDKSEEISLKNVGQVRSHHTPTAGEISSATTFKLVSFLPPLSHTFTHKKSSQATTTHHHVLFSAPKCLDWLFS